jgi:hypothetical protein
VAKCGTPGVRRAGRTHAESSEACRGIHLTRLLQAEPWKQRNRTTRGSIASICPQVKTRKRIPLSATFIHEEKRPLSPRHLFHLGEPLSRGCGFLMKIPNPTIADEIVFFFERDHPRAKAMFLPVVDPINQFSSRCLNIAGLASRQVLSGSLQRLARAGRSSIARA